MSPFYTGTGDNGYTGLLGEGRVPKYNPRMEAVGQIDEASAALGLGRALSRSESVHELLLKVQRDLYHMMAEVASLPENASRFRKIDGDRVAWLEAQTEAIGEQVEMPAEFIIPGDSPGGAALALARTVIRRAERQVALMLHNGEIENAELLRYINRLSSLCFVMELFENQHQGLARPTLAKD